MNRRCGTSPHRCARERGAATLMAVLFLLIVIAFAVLVATSMSGSDITDTSLGQSGVSALLLAESGIERAAARYVAGTPCNSLAVDGPYALGQGSFTINAHYTTDFSGASLPAGECRVQSVGTVGRVQRTVQAILQLPASSGFVVGNGGVALQCSGTTCTQTPTPNGTGNLVGVSCPTSTSCIAVDNLGNAIGWNGSVWTTLPSSGIPQYTSVACEPGNGNDCFAIGSWFGFVQLVLQWNGSAWSPPYYVGWFAPAFTDIACAGTGATTCYAVTTSNAVWVGNSGGGTVEYANNKSALSAISCASNTDCWATESSVSGKNGYFDQRKASGWGAPQPVPVGNNATGLNAISCDALNDCWAVVAESGNHSTFAYWNGIVWTVQSGTKMKQDLYGIDCLSSTDCWAVGANAKGNGTVVKGTGAAGALAWSVFSSTSQQLNAVSFPSGTGSGGSAVVIQWREIES
ncbi:MAG: hypothetical protein ACYDHY_08305 [Acidiferrobacterales bacterium]